MTNESFRGEYSCPLGGLLVPLRGLSNYATYKLVLVIDLQHFFTPSSPSARRDLTRCAELLFERSTSSSTPPSTNADDLASQYDAYAKATAPTPRPRLVANAFYRQNVPTWSKEGLANLPEGVVGVDESDVELGFAQAVEVVSELYCLVVFCGTVM